MDSLVVGSVDLSDLAVDGYARMALHAGWVGRHHGRNSRCACCSGNADDYAFCKGLKAAEYMALWAMTQNRPKNQYTLQ